MSLPEAIKLFNIGSTAGKEESIMRSPYSLLKKAIITLINIKSKNTRNILLLSFILMWNVFFTRPLIINNPVKNRIAVSKYENPNPTSNNVVIWNWDKTIKHTNPKFALLFLFDKTRNEQRKRNVYIKYTTIVGKVKLLATDLLGVYRIWKYSLPRHF